MSPPGWTWLGRAPWREVAELQEATRARILAGEPAEHLYFVEHEPVITLGRSASEKNLRVPADGLAARGVALERASRGGDATVHGPGQLVVYPVITLHHGVLAHVAGTGEAIAAELRERGLDRARFSRDPVGVFVGEAKIAACGVHVAKRVAIHGWSLNVERKIRELFALIVPCGLPDVPITSIEDELGHAPALAELCAPLATRFARAREEQTSCHMNCGR